MDFTTSPYWSKVEREIRIIESLFPLKLRPYQIEIIVEALIDINENIEENKRSSVLIEAPTGAGKTVIGLFLVKALERFYFKDCQTNWCAMRRELLHQAKNANEEQFKLNNSMRYVSLFASEVPTGDILVMDEAHHDSTFSGANIHKMSEAKIVLGLTATPARSDQVDLYFVKKIHAANTQRLVDEGFLMKYDHFFISEWSVPLIVEAYLKRKEEFGQTVFFVKNGEECEKLTQALKNNNINVEQVHSKVPLELRDQRIKDFKSKKIDALVNINVLTEGFDYDDLKTVFCRPSQKSLVKQMAGRSLRPTSLFDRVNIVQSTDTHFKYYNEVKPEGNFKYYEKEGEWRKDGIDFDKIKYVVESQTLHAILELQKINGNKRKAQQLEKTIMKKEIKRQSFNYYKILRDRIDQFAEENPTARVICFRTLNRAMDRHRTKKIQNGKSVCLEHDFHHLIKVCEDLNLNHIEEVAEYLAKNKTLKKDLYEKSRGFQEMTDAVWF